MKYQELNFLQLQIDLRSHVLRDML